MSGCESYADRYGPEVGPKRFRLARSQAGHAGVSARLRRKIADLMQPGIVAKKGAREVLPMVPEPLAIGR
jgi:hypothetical protein